MSTLNTKIVVTGDKVLNGQLENVKRKMQVKALRKIVNVATKQILKIAKDKCPKSATGTKALYRSLGRRIRVKKKIKTAAVIGRVYPRKGFDVIDAAGNKHEPQKIAHIIEYGRKAVTVKTKQVLSNGQVIFGKKVASVAAHPFMRPALEEGKQVTSSAAVEAVGEVLNPEL